ncbi:hypothetical protein [Psychromicrobium xiongbiense]|uniref:hypothetical protein n=1 Tax=Psychromicrobium xiongbiense TaxID=3051184 RepID=UPI002552428E|nr:hypothetical protein [Psychromicrobium sp. YIM S02556]
METSSLILTRTMRELGLDPRVLVDRERRGELHRVRHGSYMRVAEWDTLDERQRHGMRACSWALSSTAAPVFARESAALLWGLPLASCPSKPTVLTSDTSRGRSRGDIRRVRGLDRAVEEVVAVGGLLVTSKSRTVLELASRLSFPWSLAIVDAAFRSSRPNPDGSWNARKPWGPPCSPEELAVASQGLLSRAGEQRAMAVARLGSGLSESAGESLSRAQMHLLGFQIPELQSVFVLDDGTDARADFHWRDAGIVGEFDGKEKYYRQDWSPLTPQERVFAEKRREDALRALGLKVVRWTWSDLRRPAHLAGILTRAGVPRNKRHSPGTQGIGNRER